MSDWRLPKIVERLFLCVAYSDVLLLWPGYLFDLCNIDFIPLASIDLLSILDEI